MIKSKLQNTKKASNQKYLQLNNKRQLIDANPAIKMQNRKIRPRNLKNRDKMKKKEERKCLRTLSYNIKNGILIPSG
jgi:hypothetical protein